MSHVMIYRDTTMCENVPVTAGAGKPPAVPLKVCRLPAGDAAVVEVEAAAAEVDTAAPALDEIAAAVDSADATEVDTEATDAETAPPFPPAAKAPAPAAGTPSAVTVNYIEFKNVELPSMVPRII